MGSNLQVSRVDTRWINQQNTFGTSADPTVRTVFGFSARLERTELESMFRHDWLSRAIVTSIADDATREWLTLVAEEESARADDVMDALDSLDTQNKFNEAITLSRLYGGSIIIMGAYDGQQLEEPLNEEAVRWFGFLLVLDRWQVFPRAWYRDPGHPKFGLPSHYLVQPITQGGASFMNFVIHESRVIRLDGGFLPIRLRLRNIGWGDSALEPAYEAIRQFGIAAQTGAALLEDFVIKIYKMADLPEKLGAGQLDQVQERIRLAASQMSVHGITAIGPDDEITKEGTPTQGLSNLHKQYEGYAAGAAQIPKSRLYGNQSGILGSSSADSDMRTYYDKVKSFQTNKVESGVKRIAMLKAKAEGLPTEGWDIQWKPLWQFDEVTRSQIAVNFSQAHANWIQNGVLEPEEVAEAVFGGDGISFEDIILDQELRAKLEAEGDEQEALEADLAERMQRIEETKAVGAGAVKE